MKRSLILGLDLPALRPCAAVEGRRASRSRCLARHRRAALRPDNAAVFRRLIAVAGGQQAARFAIFPSAARTDRPAAELQDVLAGQGIPPEHIRIVDITPDNADRQAANPEVLEQIRSATAAFFVGGDQVRIVPAF